MADKIPLVSGDNRPYITLELTQVDGSPVDITGATVTVEMRAVGSSTILATMPVTITNAGGGVGYFNFLGAVLDVPAGPYEGEVNVVFSNGDKQTVYDLLKFTVRSKF